MLDYDFANLSADGEIIYDTSGNAYNGQVSGGEKAEKDGETYLKFDGNTVIRTPLTTLGYPYTMSLMYIWTVQKRIRKNPLCSPVMTEDCSLRVSMVP